MIAAALRSRILADSQLAGQLALYDAGAGPAAALFTALPAPADCPQPLITISEEGGTPWGTRAQRGAESAALVTLRGDKSRSEKALSELAQQLWLRLHRAELTLSGFTEVGCLARPPERAADPQGFPEYRIRVTVRLLES
jgi:hypothetical protein